ncbi:MAG TPA: T9SS type A sorting domain-containing protein, partial [Chitinophagaceae bacterium]|nr:T9SS type A sorting domain-containing protein [Chitinophagaceae bacterium]
SYYFAVATNSKDGDVTGLHYSTSPRNTFVGFDWWIVKLGKETVSQKASPGEGLSPSLSEQAILAHPNPFVNSTTIGFTAWESARASVDLYDLHGRKIMTVWSGNAVSGQRYHATLREANIPKGNYIFVITNGKGKKSGRLMKLD